MGIKAFLAGTIALIVTTSIFGGEPASAQLPRELLHKVDLQYGNIEFFGLDQTRKVALTFDDGPGQGTVQILDTLKRFNIKATFFVTGERARRNPQILQRIVDEGHVLANHSYTHANLAHEKYAQEPLALVEELKRTHEVIKPYLKPGARLYFRAPYAAWQSSNADAANSDPELANYVGPICWDAGRSIEWNEGEYTNAADWACWSKKHDWTPIQCAIGYHKKISSLRGGVVLMHDIHRKTAEMVDLLLPQLIGDGYSFVTLDEIGELRRYSPGSGPSVKQAPVLSKDSSGRCTTPKKTSIGPVPAMLTST